MAYAVPPPVLEAVRASRRVLLLTHARPDGDGLGSNLALRLALLQLGKEAVIANRDRPAVRYRFLPGIESVQVGESVSGDFDLAIVCDCGDPAQLGGIVDLAALRARGGTVLCMDHHERHVPFATLDFIEPTAAATGEMAFSLIEALGVPVDADMASCLYASLITDTGSFQYSSTSPDTHRLAAQLLERGIPFPEICERIFHTYSAAQVRLWGQALASLRTHHDGKIATVRLTAKDLAEAGEDATSTEGFINPVRGIETVEVAAFFVEVSPSETKLSMRSRGTVDVADLAASFGGGGHIRASGCTIALPLEAAERAALARIEEYLRRAKLL